jgi:hypothetical protein
MIVLEPREDRYPKLFYVWIVQFDQNQVIVYTNLDVCDIRLVSHVVKSVDFIILGT